MLALSKLAKVNETRNRLKIRMHYLLSNILNILTFCLKHVLKYPCTHYNLTPFFFKNIYVH